MTRRHSAMRALVAVALAGPALLLGGCPSDTARPDPPPSTPCVTMADCAGDAGASCGLLRACVDGYCEADPSLHVPCP